jgi:hypothetical protein
MDRAAADADTLRALRAAPADGLAVDVWDVTQFLEPIRATFGAEITSISRASLLAVRFAIEQAQWRTAFDGKFTDHPRAQTLLWHFSPWELARLHRESGLGPDDILQPGLYAEAIAVFMWATGTEQQWWVLSTSCTG